MPRRTDDEPDYASLPLGRLLSVAGSLLAERWRQVTERNEISVAYTVVLFELVAEDGLSHREVARRCWLSPATVTATADRMERDGLVERVRNPHDRRVVRLFLSDAGAEYAERAGKVLREQFGAFFPRTTAADEGVIRRYLGEMVRNLTHEGDNT